MIKSFESTMGRVTSRRSQVTRMFWALGLATSLCSVFSVGIPSAAGQISKNAPGACCTSHGCEVAVFRNGLYSCDGVISLNPFNGSCSIGACVLPDGSCIQADQMCGCPGLGGTSLGGGTACPEPPQACCGSDPLGIGDSGSCADMIANDCTLAGGVPAGPGTDCSLIGSSSDNICSVFRACCGLQVADHCANDNLFMCVSAGGSCQGVGTNCQLNADGDDYADVCDNCPFDFNNTQANSDNDTVGDACDNCVLNDNVSQDDADADGVGDACDNCVNTVNGPGGFCIAGRIPASCTTDADCDSTTISADGICAALSGTCTAGSGVGVAACTTNADCDTCPNLGNGICSTNQDNCGGASAGDACDSDIDGDGVLNADDLCDFTPAGANIETAAGSPFLGTLRADLDGDCDVDVGDYNVWYNNIAYPDPACPANGSDVEDPLCGATITCPSTGGNSSSGGLQSDSPSASQTAGGSIPQ